MQSIGGVEASVASRLRQHLKLFVAGQCATGRVDSDVAGCDSAGHCSRQVGVGLHGKGGSGSVEGNASGFGQALSTQEDVTIWWGLSIAVT
jgi:hypothetical protein